MSLDSDVIVDRRRIRRKLTFWRVAAVVVAIAAIATRLATTRQNVSFRRILRRSTITSESSDIEFLLKYPGRFASAALAKLYLITSIAVQYEENKTPAVQS